MGVVVRSEETFVSELERCRRMLVACAGVQRRKDGKEFKSLKLKPIDDADEKVVCVTSGVSFLGSAIVNELSLHGYFVRVIVDNPEDVNKLEETTSGRHNVTVVVADLTDVNSLVEAFNGCRGVFHTSSSIDPSGVSGYTKVMSEVEVRTTENVMEACARTETVRNCVLTSSLLACIWRDQAGESESIGSSRIVDHACWEQLTALPRQKAMVCIGETEIRESGMENSTRKWAKTSHYLFCAHNWPQLPPQKFNSNDSLSQRSSRDVHKWSTGNGGRDQISQSTRLCV